jgi:hypothetical protein
MMQPPFAMDNEAQLSAAVVAAPHDTFRPTGSTALQAEIGVLGAAVIPLVFSPPALDVLVFDDEGRTAQSAVLRSAVE